MKYCNFCLSECSSTVSNCKNCSGSSFSNTYEEAEFAKKNSTLEENNNSISVSAAPNTTDKVDVVLLSSGERKLYVLKVLYETLKTGLLEAKDFVDGTPCTIAKQLNKNEAMALKAKLEAEGAEVELR